MFKKSSQKQEKDPAVNPNRTADLYNLTEDNYIIAQDIRCQYELVESQPCHHCQGKLLTVAQINRAFQGLNELVAVCSRCTTHYTFIFDISNDDYQTWWAERMGDNYVRMYDGAPRKPAEA